MSNLSPCVYCNHPAEEHVIKEFPIVLAGLVEHWEKYRECHSSGGCWCDRYMPAPTDEELEHVDPYQRALARLWIAQASFFRAIETSHSLPELQDKLLLCKNVLEDVIDGHL